MVKYLGNLIEIEIDGKYDYFLLHPNGFGFEVTHEQINKIVEFYNHKTKVSTECSINFA
jgi:hypothetical protein